MTTPPTSRDLPLNRSAIRAVATGFPLTLETGDLRSKYGFADGDLLADFIDELVNQDLIPRESEVRATALLHLVTKLLLEPLADEGCIVEVAMWGTAHNPIRLRSVQGLTNNERALPSLSAHVDPDTLTDAIVVALEGPPNYPDNHPHPSALDAGLRALVGRSVEVQINASAKDDVVMGVLVAITDDALVLVRSSNWGSEGLTVVPHATVRAISTSQLTPAEDELVARLL